MSFANAGGRASDDAIRSVVTSCELFRAPLLIEPDVFHAPAVEDAVDHDSQPFHIGLPASRAPVVKDDRPGPVIGQLPFDLPDEMFALFGVGLDG